VKIISLANQKGGVGKTTTAVNLAVCLAELGEKILLIDLDPQANATSALGFEIDVAKSLYGPLMEKIPLAGVIQTTQFANLSFVGSDLNLAGAEVELARSNSHLDSLANLLETSNFEGQYSYIFLDCPPSLGILMTAALAASDEIIIPLQCEYFGLEGLSQIVNVLEQVTSSGTNPKVFIEGIVMTMFDKRTNLSQQVVDEVRKHFSDTLYQTIIPRTVRLGESPSFGKPIIEYDPKGTGALSYKKLAEEFLNRRK